MPGAGACCCLGAALLCWVRAAGQRVGKDVSRGSPELLLCVGQGAARSDTPVPVLGCAAGLNADADQVLGASMVFGGLPPSVLFILNASRRL